MTYVPTYIINFDIYISASYIGGLGDQRLWLRLIGYKRFDSFQIRKIVNLFTVRNALVPLKMNDIGLPEFDHQTQQSSVPWVFVGGDLCGIGKENSKGAYKMRKILK